MKNENISYKICSKCRKELPETKEYFVIASNTKSGLGAMCRECRHDSYMKKREYYIEKSRKYYKENRNKILEKQKIYAEQNKEHKREYDKKYREKNRDKDKERLKIYYENNKEYLSQYIRKYYIANKESIKETNKRWVEKNCEKVRQMKRRRKNKIKQIKSDLTLEQWEEIKKFFNYECACCGKKEKLEQDHFIAVSKGGEYTKTNIIPLCRRCNASKNDSDFNDWYKMQEFYDKEKENKILKFLGGIV